MLTLLISIALPIFRKISICCRWFFFVWVIILFSLHLEEWSMNNNMVSKKGDQWITIIVSKIWVGMITTNIHLLQFKTQGHFQKRGVWIEEHQNSCQRNTFKISNITFTILPFSNKNIFTDPNYHDEHFQVYYFWWNHQMRVKMVHSNTKNGKSRACQSQACYLCTTHSSALQAPVA